MQVRALYRSRIGHVMWTDGRRLLRLNADFTLISFHFSELSADTVLAHLNRKLYHL